MTAVANFFETTPRNWRARLAVASDFMRELSRHTDPEDLYRAYVRRMAHIYPTSRHVSFTRRGLDAPHLRVMRFSEWANPVNPHKEPDRLPVIDRGILSDLLYADDTKVIDDLCLSSDDPAAEFFEGQRSLLAIPLFEGGSAVSMVALTREEAHAFPREQVPELVWMCNLFSRALQTQALSDRLQETYNAADFELKAIGDLQHSLLPASIPKPAGLELAVHYRTANRAGGDYYDFFPLPGGKFGVLIADVSGHGTQAAVLLTITHSLAHAYPEPPVSPNKFLAHLNRHLSRRYTQPTGSFITATYAVFDPSENALTYSTAGHLPPRLCAAGQPSWQPLPSPSHLPLGVTPRDAEYPEQVIRFAPGDRVALYTDGVVDAVDRTGEPFGHDRLDAALAWSKPDADSVVKEAIAALDRFIAGAKLADDRTLLVVRRTEPLPPRPPSYDV